VAIPRQNFRTTEPDKNLEMQPADLNSRRGLALSSCYPAVLDRHRTGTGRTGRPPANVSSAFNNACAAAARRARTPLRFVYFLLLRFRHASS
jgi:hypothetical protein